jgi:hypothetical protein
VSGAERQKELEMTDTILIFALLLAFATAVLYVDGCDRLKGAKRV